MDSFMATGCEGSGAAEIKKTDTREDVAGTGVKGKAQRAKRIEQSGKREAGRGKREEEVV